VVASGGVAAGAAAAWTRLIGPFPMEVLNMNSLSRLLLLAVCVVMGSNAHVGAQQASGSAAELQKLEREVEAAMVAADVARLDGIYAEDFRFTHGGAKVQTRKDWLEALRSGASKYTRRDLSEVDIEVHGDVALATGRVDVQPAAGKAYAVRYVRVYAQRSGRWQLLLQRTVQTLDAAAK
jgi:ketosteroid isomerase-like protein